MSKTEILKELIDALNATEFPMNVWERADIEKLEALKKAKEKAESALSDDGWVSCVDEMPKLNESVLAWHKTDLLGYSDIVDEWMDEYAEKFNITHWQPLPNPPKSK